MESLVDQMRHEQEDELVWRLGYGTFCGKKYKYKC